MMKKIFGTCVVGAMVIGGCGHATNKEKAHKPDSGADVSDALFQSESLSRSVDHFMTKAAANGALQDATMYPCHFTGNRLNSSGCVKLDLMLQAHEADDAMIVYVADPMRDEKAMLARREAVAAYIKHVDGGIEHLDVRAGMNDAVGAPAAGGLANLHKTDSEYVSQSSSSGGYGPTSTGASGAMNSTPSR